MSKRRSIQILGTAITVIALAVAFGIAAGSSAGSTSTSAAKLNTVTIAMRDPGCHWFAVGGKYKSHLTVDGKTAFLNRDEAALIFKGNGFFQRVPVGKSIIVAKPGVYRIVMVKQPADDNTLVLTVK